MANPYHHSVSSVKTWGGRVEDYQAIHHFFDESKSHHPDFRHRSLRHHREGIALAVQLFGPMIRLSDGREVSVEEVGVQHMMEDIGRVPTVAEWYDSMVPQPWMEPRGNLLRDGGESSPEPEALAMRAAESAASRWGGDALDYLPVVAWFTQSAACFPDARFRAARYHSEGIFMVERLLGPTLTTSTGRKVPTRWVAERHIIDVMGKIPTVQDWVGRILPQPWMRRIGKKVEDDPEIQRIEAEMLAADMLTPVSQG